MKRFFALASILMMTAGLSFAGEYTGYLSDLKCAKAGKGASADHATCAQNCVKGGGVIAFVNADGKVYKVTEGADLAKDHVGHKVTVAGMLEGEGDAAVAKLTKVSM